MTTKQRKAALVKLNELAAAKRAPMPLHTAIFGADDAEQVASEFR